MKRLAILAVFLVGVTVISCGEPSSSSIDPNNSGGPVAKTVEPKASPVTAGSDSSMHENITSQRKTQFVTSGVVAASADGITMDMMPITYNQVAQCLQQASSQVTNEQKTPHDGEHGQNTDKTAQSGITGTTGAVTSAISRKNNYGWWGGGNNNGAQTAAATGATQRTDRNSQAVASTTATWQTLGVDAYQQCVNGVKGPEYVRFRQTGQITALDMRPSATGELDGPRLKDPISPYAIQSEGDGKHFLLTVLPRELTLVSGSSNTYVDPETGDKFIALPGGSVIRILPSPVPTSEHPTDSPK